MTAVQVQLAAGITSTNRGNLFVDIEILTFAKFYWGFRARWKALSFINFF